MLITGETGTGKELVARALHFDGPRRDRPFVEINCAAIPAQLLESELFGHERGAFTDARARKLGLVETADGGTLFLDEIGDMELPPAGASCLRLLEEKTVRRLGSLRDQQVDVRIVAATHRPLETLVAEGRFRADLLFRIRIVHLAVPALRDRESDVMLLAQHYLAAAREALRQARRCRCRTRCSAALRRHRWPGNVRELRNVMEQAVLLASGPDDRVDRHRLVSGGGRRSRGRRRARRHADVEPRADRTRHAQARARGGTGQRQSRRPPARRVARHAALPD